MLPYVFAQLLEKIQDVPEVANERESESVCFRGLA